MVQIILGFSAALKDPAYDALFSTTSKKHLALAWGEWEAMDYIVAGIGALAGGFLAKYFGFQILLYFMLLMSILSLVISLLIMRSRRN